MVAITDQEKLTPAIQLEMFSSEHRHSIVIITITVIIMIIEICIIT